MHPSSVDTPTPEVVATEIEGRDDVAVLSATALADNERELFADILEVPLDLMIAIAFAGGTLIVALAAYSSIAERIREYGIVKALGRASQISSARFSVRPCSSRPWAPRRDFSCISEVRGSSKS